MVIKPVPLNPVHTLPLPAFPGMNFGRQLPVRGEEVFREGGKMFTFEEQNTMFF